jgi:hypothetical protein
MPKALVLAILVLAILVLAIYEPDKTGSTRQARQDKAVDKLAQKKWLYRLLALIEPWGC